MKSLSLPEARFASPRVAAFTFIALAGAGSGAFALELPDGLRPESPRVIDSSRALEAPDPDFSPRADFDSDPYVPSPEVAIFWEAPAAQASTASKLHAELRLPAALFDDMQLGARIGGRAWGARIPLGFFLDFEGRPYGKAVRVRESDVLEYQFREHRFTISPGAFLDLPLENGDWWMFAAGVGLSFGTYRGSARSAEVTAPVWFEAGYRASIGARQYLGIGYQYFPLPDASPHRVSVQWGVRWRPPSR